MITLIILLIIIIYIIPFLMLCIDRYRFFKGKKLKNYFNEEYYDEESAYGSYDGIGNLMTFLPILNIFFCLYRVIKVIYDIILVMSDKIGFSKIFNHFINLKIKK